MANTSPPILAFLGELKRIFPEVSKEKVTFIEQLAESLPNTCNPHIATEDGLLVDFIWKYDETNGMVVTLTEENTVGVSRFFPQPDSYYPQHHYELFESLSHVAIEHIVKLVKEGDFE